MTTLAIALGVTVVVSLVAVVMLRRRVAELRAELASTRLSQSDVVLQLADQRTNAERLEVAIERLPIAVAAYDSTGDVVFANQLARRYISARHGEAVVEREIQQLVGAAIEKAEEMTRDLELHAAGKSHLYLEVVPIERGDGIAAVVVIEDRTQRHRTDAIRRDFVANVSHELKTPLGALSVLAGALEGETSPEARFRLTRRIAAEATRMGRLIEDILDLSRVEGEPFEPAVVLLDDLVRSAVSRADTGAKRLGVSVYLSLPEERVAVTGDARQLESAVANLLSNAVKFTAAAADPAATVRVTLETTDDEAVLRVVDEGIGIGRDHLDRIFERFYRADRSRSRGSGGTGLGLAIVRHVVMNHGGQIEVESELGTGSTFTVRLPYDASIESSGREA